MKTKRSIGKFYIEKEKDRIESSVDITIKLRKNIIVRRERVI